MSDRRQAWIFIVSVLAASWGFETFIILNGGVRAFGPLWIVALMCIPGILSVALRLILNSGFGDVGFRVGRGRYYIYAIAVPLSVATLVALLSVVFDIRRFSLISPEQLILITPVLLSILGLGLVGAFGRRSGGADSCCLKC